MGKKTEIAQFGSVFSIHLGIKETIDWGLTTLIMLDIGLGLGYVLSYLITTLIYILLGVLYLKIYALYKNELRMFEDLKEIQNTDLEVKKKWVIRLILKIVGSKQLLLVIVLYLKNPGLLIVWLRINSKYSEFKIKFIVGLYLFSISAIWNLIIYLGISTLEKTWLFVKELF